MERRNFLKLAIGVAAGGAALATGAQAAPLLPQPVDDPARGPSSTPEAHPAVTSTEEAARLTPEQVHWHGHWHRRHWGWRRRWHHRHWRHW